MSQQNEPLTIDLSKSSKQDIVVLAKMVMSISRILKTQGYRVHLIKKTPPSSQPLLPTASK